MQSVLGTVIVTLSNQQAGKLIMCELQLQLQLQISDAELSHKGKVILIKEYLNRCSGRKVTYTSTVIGNELTVFPAFKTQDGFERVKAGILEILNDMCEEMDGRGRGCGEHYNCCDCGGNNCGCAYCFSCNACDNCL